MPPSTLTPEQVRRRRQEEAERLYASGLTLEQVGDRLGISRQRVQQVLAKRGVARRSSGFRPIPISQDQQEQIVDLYKEGLSVRQIRQKMNLCDTRVRRVLRVHGVAFRRSGAARKYDAETRAVAVAAYLSSRTNTTVSLGRKYGVMPSVIGNWVREAGHKLRQGGEAYGYTEEVRQQAVSRVIDLGESCQDVAAGLGFATKTIARWVKHATPVVLPRPRAAS